MATLKEFEDALREAGNTAALEILERLRARDRANRSIRPARRITGQKMTPELAAEIVRLHRSTDMTQQEIAFQLGVNQGRVNEVLKRGKWLDGDPASPEAIARDKGVERAKRGEGFEPRSKTKAKATPVPAPDAEPESAPEPAAARPEQSPAPPPAERPMLELTGSEAPQAPAIEPPMPETVAPPAEKPTPKKKSAGKKSAEKTVEPKTEPAEEPAQLLFKL